MRGLSEPSQLGQEQLGLDDTFANRRGIGKPEAWIVGSVRQARMQLVELIHRRLLGHDQAAIECGLYEDRLRVEASYPPGHAIEARTQEQFLA